MEIEYNLINIDKKEAVKEYLYEHKDYDSSFDMAEAIDKIYNTEGQIESVELTNWDGTVTNINVCKKGFFHGEDKCQLQHGMIQVLSMNKQELRQYIEVLQKIEKQLEG